jgi:LysR family glycine cleavage system transcriptional activator
MSVSRTPLNWLRAFEAAARCGSFAAAATELNVTPSAISQHIRALEQRLGRSLFDRHANGVALTSTGRRYAEELGRGFTLIEEATAKVAGEGARELLVIHVPTSFATQWIAPRLDLFHEAHPQIDLRLTALGNGVDHSNTKADAEIRYGWGEWMKLTAVEFLREQLIPVCSPAFAARLQSPNDLRGRDLLHVAGYVENWDTWLSYAGVSDIDTSEGASFDQSIMAIRAAAEGKGIILGRSSLIQRELAAGQLVAPFDHILECSGGYWFMATPQNAKGHKVMAFRDWLLANAAR